MPVNEPGTNAKASKPKPKAKKLSVDKDSKNPSHTSEAKSNSKTGDSSSSTSCQKVVTSDWFITEIQSMMHGFGDCKKPSIESARLVEEIVHQQMNTVLFQAAEVASTRGARFIGPEDIIFLTRRNKAKLARLIKYLSMKDLKIALMKNIGIDEEEITEGAGDVKPQPQRPKRSKLCYDFISFLDQSGELLSAFDEEVFDEIKHERELRMDYQTRCMDQAQYLEYAESRRSSFSRKYRTTKFRDWLLKDNLTDIKPSALALELFNYLAYETVAQIVDLALLVRQDMQQNLFERIQPPVVYNPDYPSIQTASHSFRSTMSARPESPSQPNTSPPSSPSAQSNISHPTPPASAVPQGKPKPPKKRRKSEVHITQEALGPQGIQPADIREAIRRYWTQSGPFLLFSKVHNSSMAMQTLCC